MFKTDYPLERANKYRAMGYDISGTIIFDEFDTRSNKVFTKLMGVWVNNE